MDGAAPLPPPSTPGSPEKAPTVLKRLPTFADVAEFAARAVWLVLLLVTGGCASLPGDVVRPPTTAPAAAAVQATTLARVAAASTPDDERERSGFALLADGADALQARLALIERAERTVDVQYYLIASDRSGNEFRAALAAAAARGVRVRVLVDDLYATGQDAVYAGLAATPNVEVRLFNPLPVRGASFAGRIARSLHELGRINRRMHNKLLVADAAFAIAGGRNIADEYFDRHAAGGANFIDMDVLASGAVVAELEHAFDAYWNSTHAYPLSSLVGGGAAAPSAAGPERASAAASSTPTAVAAALRAGRVALTFADASVLADAPEKVEGGGPSGAVAAGHRALLERAHAEVVLSSPYFVPSEAALAALGRALARDVRVTVLTNSRATTDEPIVHVGYARRRAELLAAGADLHELMPSAAASAREDDGGSDGDEPASRAPFGASGSAGRLHSKLAVVDGRTLFVGSMNMDRRSESSNTELGLVIESRALATEVAMRLTSQLDERSYRVRLGADGRRLRWLAGRGDEQSTHAAEPAGMRAGFARRLMLAVLGDEML